MYVIVDFDVVILINSRILLADCGLVALFSAATQNK